MFETVLNLYKQHKTLNFERKFEVIVYVEGFVHFV